MPADSGHAADAQEPAGNTQPSGQLANQAFTPATPMPGSCLTNQPTGKSVQVTDASFGAVGDGRTDDTAAIQRAIDQVADAGGGTVNVPGGTYMINPIAHQSSDGLAMRSNVTLRLAPDAVLKALPTSSTHYSLVAFLEVGNANLIGGTLVGERYEHRGQGGEWGHGVNIHSSHDVVVENVTSKDFWGDGFYIGQIWTNRNSHSERVSLCNVTSHNNRRQGLSIVDGINVRVLNSTFANTNGLAPEAGLDIEPEDGNRVDNVEVRGSVFSANNGDGIVLTWNEYKDASITRVYLIGNQVLNNKKGIMLHRAQNCQVIDNTIRNAGNQTNLDFPMTLHLFSGATGNLVSGNTNIGGRTVDDGSGNNVSEGVTAAGAYIRGSMVVGQTLWAEVLDVDGVPADTSYQWYADGVAIPGATSAHYQLTANEAEKAITVTVTFADRAGNNEQATSMSAKAVRHG